MQKQEFLDSLTILTSQFTFLQDAIKSSYGPHCDNCDKSLLQEGYLIMGTKKLCGPCMDHAN